jgi:hypothetical protein
MLLNTKKIKWLAILIIVWAPIGSCVYNKEELLYPGNSQATDCTTSPATFNADVFPLITSKCAISGCHDETASGGHIFQSYNEISSAKDHIYNMAVINKAMPPTGPLPANEINILRCWIEGGALNN